MTFELAMLMKKSHKSSSVQSIHDLSQQSKIKYGVVAGGSTYSFFEDSDNEGYERMRSIMDTAGNSSKVETVKAGVKRVRKSTDDQPFAFIGEQYAIEYHASREPCELTSVKGNVEEFRGEYHLAVRKDLAEATANKLAEAVRNLKDSGRLEELYNKWWVDRAQCSRAPSSAFTAGILVLVPIVVALFRVSGE